VQSLACRADHGRTRIAGQRGSDDEAHRYAKGQCTRCERHRVKQESHHCRRGADWKKHTPSDKTLIRRADFTEFAERVPDVVVTGFATAQKNERRSQIESGE